MNADLWWAQKVNDEDGIGLFGPTLRKYGPVPECEELVAKGLMTRVNRADCKRPRQAGYWITDAGRQFLQNDGNN